VKNEDRRLTVIIPTYKRPRILERLLSNLSEQELIPDEVLVVDSSEDDLTTNLCQRLSEALPFELKLLRSRKGLTIQRNVGIDESRGKFVAMLDDDVVLDKGCLRILVGSLLDPANADVIGISGYIANEWGKEQSNWWHGLMKKLGFFPGELRPGKYLDWGYPVELNFLKPFTGIIYTDFLPGGATLWRRHLYEAMRPNPDIFTYGGEDKEFSLRAGKKYRLAISGDARLEHHHVPGGARPHPFFNGFFIVRNMLYIFKYCRDDRQFLKKVKLHLYFVVESARMFVTALTGMKLGAAMKALGIFSGSAYYFAFPPKAGKK